MAGEARPKVAIFFASKNRPGLLIGRSEGQNLETLIQTIKDAKSQGKNVVFFLWANDRGTGGFAASMTAAVDEPMEQRGAVESKPIQQAARPVAKAPAPSVFDTEPAAAAKPAAKSVFDL